MAKIEVNCTKCQKVLLRFKSQIPKSGKSFCSISCGISFRNKYEFNPSHSRDISGGKNPMYGKGHLITGEKNGMFGRLGELSPAWKGGRYIRKDGYVRINENGTHILEHRKIMKDTGIDIENKIVHHRNRNRTDNSKDNLEVLDRKAHAQEHLIDMLSKRNDLSDEIKEKYAITQ